MSVESAIHNLIEGWMDDNLTSKITDAINDEGYPSEDTVDEKIADLRSELEGEFVTDSSCDDKISDKLDDMKTEILDELREEFKGVNEDGVILNPQATFEAVRDCFAQMPLAQRLELLVTLLTSPQARQAAHVAVTAEETRAIDALGIR